MSESEQNKKPDKKSDFMIEKIKERPVNKKKLLRRTVITASMAVIFGLIACLTFLILEPVFNNWLYPEAQPEQVELLPEETDEMLPVDMVVEDPPVPDLQETVESVLTEGGKIEEILSKLKLTTEHYKQLATAMLEYSQGLSKSMVTVTGITSNTDWFNNTFENTGQVSGVILANNGKELLILADRAVVKKAESILVTFFDGLQLAATEKQYDSATGLTVLSVLLTDIREETLSQVTVASLGGSNLRHGPGTPIIAIGSPMGVSNSVNYGIITSNGNMWSTTDANYNLIMTDIYGSQNASGVLFNMQSQVVAIITTGKGSSDMKNIITGIGITELTPVITQMSNGEKRPYLGISGVDVTYQANSQIGVPFGAYVRNIEMNSPAMLAGMQRGDVISRLDEIEINNFGNYVNTLQKLRPGETVEISVQRQVKDNYKEIKLKITLGESN